jgi:glycosyltransferase involved in cell wall biosynthesis
MSKASVRVSLGLPVYNGENYVGAAIESILAQEFAAFELIISDNASTDGTAAICRAYAASDSRIRYERAETNHGAAWNFNRVVELAQGEYFKWCAHDDLLAPRFLTSCVAALDGDDGAVNANPRTRIIDAAGEPLEDFVQGFQSDDPRPELRYHKLIGGHNCFEVFGLIRLAVLKRTILMGNFSHGDGALLSHLGLFGRFHEVGEYLFLLRKHLLQSNLVYQAERPGPPDYHRYAAWFDPAYAGRIVFPYWKLLQVYAGLPLRAPLRPGQIAMCYLYLAYWAWKKRYWLVRDLQIGAFQLRARLAGRATRLLEDWRRRARGGEPKPGGEAVE